jgi:hypothetical protein
VNLKDHLEKDLFALARIGDLAIKAHCARDLLRFPHPDPNVTGGWIDMSKRADRNLAEAIELYRFTPREEAGS